MDREVRGDYYACTKRTPTFGGMLQAFFQISGFRAAVLYRWAHRRRNSGHRIVAAFISRLIRTTCHMDIEVAVRIGEGIWFPHTWGTVIGGLSIIGKNCVILQGVTIGGTGNRKRANGQTQPIIGDNVMIGAGAKILGPVLIGDRVKVGANSVVLSDVKPGLAVMGVPAKNIFSN